MRHKKTHSLILLALLLIIILMKPFPLANPGGGSIIWSAERQLTFDPVEWEIDPDTGENITTYYIDTDWLASVTATRANEIWLAWETDVTGNNEIFYRICKRTGEWTNDTQLTFNQSADFGPAVLQALDNKIWVFWASDRTGNDEIFYKTTVDNGVSWSTETQATTDSRSDVSPAVAQASDGKIWLAWSRKTGTNNQDIFYKTYDGTVWSGETQLTTNTNVDELPSVVQAKDGKIWIFWSQYMPDTHEQICYKFFNGVMWSGETQLTTDPIDNMDPAAFVEKDGTIWVFWALREQTGQAKFNLFYRISLDNGTTWSSSVQFTINNNKYNDMQPSAVQAPDKPLWIVWTSTRKDSNDNYNVDLYYKFSIPGDINKDGAINVADLDIIAKALGTTPTWPHGTGWNQWNPECDLNIDDEVDAIDLATAGKNYYTPP